MKIRIHMFKLRCMSNPITNEWREGMNYRMKQADPIIAILE